MTNYFQTQQRINIVSNRLKPFDWQRESGIRFTDIPIFKAASQVYDHIIIVRATNPESMQYIGCHNFIPKPIDCKPKTADKKIYRYEIGADINCAGLVVDPTLLPNAFVGRKKQEAMKCWEKFIELHTQRERDHKIFMRDGVGFYAVDTYKTSPYYGCLMLSNTGLPDWDFRLAVSYPQWDDFKQANMSYVHGDYDLYGLIDVANIQTNKLMAKEIESEQLHGETNYYTGRFKEIQEFLNVGIGADMIQHGSQDTFEHKDDKLYVFTPIGAIYTIDESADAIREIYRLIYKCVF